MDMRFNRIVAICILGFIASAYSSGAEIYVPQDCNTIQQALDQALDGDTVLVAPGTYSGPGNVNILFTQKEVSLISESGPETTVIDCNNAFVFGVWFKTGRHVTCQLRGLTIRHSARAGIFCQVASSPIIENCILENNAQGMECLDSYTAPLLRNCIIRNNISHYQGAGIKANHQATPILEGCVISGNISSSSGGGVYSGHRFSHITLRNCLLYGNEAQGGAIYVPGPNPLTLINCTVVNNRTQSGGGIFARGSDENPIVIRNCIIRDNDQEATFAARRVALLTGIHIPADPNSNMLVDNMELSYSNVQGEWPGIGNIDCDPWFVNADSGDYHLTVVLPA